MTVTIRRDSDPFKKYWWVLLVGFGLVGAWICFPLMEGGGSTSVVRDQGLKSADQSLDALNNPAGAPGSATDLSMGSYRKKGSQGTMKSSLYEPPPETAAAGAPVAAGSGGNLADALKDISRRSASADAGGWSGEKAQKGFVAPRANFGSLSGVGGGGSGSSASAGGGSYGGAGSGGGGLGAFGTEGPNTGLTATRGLGSESARPKGGVGGTMKALENAASQSAGAANQKSNDASAAMGGKNFDGSGASGQIAGPGGAALGGAGGEYAKLDAAPANLKMNNPKMDKKELQPPPAKPVPPKETSMAEQIKMMIIMMAIGGVMNMAMGGLSSAIGLGKG